MGKIVLGAYDVLQKRSTSFRNHTTLISSVMMIGLASSLVVILFSKYYSQPVNLLHVGGIISVSIIGGIELTRYLKSREE